MAAWRALLLNPEGRIPRRLWCCATDVVCLLCLFPTWIPVVLISNPSPSQRCSFPAKHLEFYTGQNVDNTIRALSPAENPGAAKKCAACKTQYYCNAACQRAHWKAEHKKDCKRWVQK